MHKHFNTFMVEWLPVYWNQYCLRDSRLRVIVITPLKQAVSDLQ